MEGLATQIEEIYETTLTSDRKLSQILESLNDIDQTALLQVLADKKVKGSAIGALLRKNGHEISDRAIQRYRKEIIWV